MQQLAEKLTEWIKEQVISAGRSGSVFGLSGGLDSAVVAVLCKRAFPLSTLAAILPCHSIDIDIEHAHAVARKFDIPTVNIPLDETFETLLRAMPRDLPDTGTVHAAQANIKPRLRMTALYYLATRLNYLVVGTSNKSELSVGYFTKYGDGGADIMPIGNLVKSQVQELALYLDIPRDIVEKPPSAGLWQGQTDEGEMGVTYAELDRYIARSKVDDDARCKIDAMVASSEHKRARPPVPSF